MNIRHTINQSVSWRYRTAGDFGGDRRKIPIPAGDDSTCTQT